LSGDIFSEYNSIDLLFEQINDLTENSCVENNTTQNYTTQNYTTQNYIRQMPTQIESQQKLIIQYTNNRSKINNTNSILNNSVNILNVTTQPTISNRKSQSVMSRKDRHKTTDKNFNNEIKYRHSKFKKKNNRQARGQ
jgi:hypothetical protein